MASKIAKFSKSITVLVIKAIPINKEKDTFQFFRSLLHSKSERLVEQANCCDRSKEWLQFKASA